MATVKVVKSFSVPDVELPDETLTFVVSKLPFAVSFLNICEIACALYPAAGDMQFVETL